MTEFCILYVLFAALGNRFLRGYTYGIKSQNWPYDALPFSKQPLFWKVVQILSSKYAFAVYLGLLLPADWWQKLALMAGCAMGFYKGSNFDILTRSTIREFNEGLVRGLRLAIPIVLSVSYPLQWTLLAAVLLLTLSYPLSYWIVGRVYGERPHSVALAEVAWGAVMGLVIVVWGVYE